MQIVPCSTGLAPSSGFYIIMYRLAKRRAVFDKRKKYRKKAKKALTRRERFVILSKQDRSARISKLSEGAREGVGCEAEKS